MNAVQDTVVIANPAAAGGRIGKGWTATEAMLRGHLGAVEFRLTNAPRHATELARDAVAAGATRIFSLGGDGTHSEVVNGIMAAAPAPGAVTLGILPGGTGGDFRRNLQHGDTIESAAAAAAGARAVPIDVGALNWQADDGSRGEGWFINIASFGVGGLVDRIVNESSKRLGGQATFFIGSLRALARYQPARVKLVLDGKELEPVPVTHVLVCNGRWAGGGMLFAPEAKLDDGLFDVVIMGWKSVLHTIGMSRHIYKGKHVGDPTVQVHRARVVEATTVGPEVAWMDVDGEAPGILPSTLSVVPGAIRLLDPRAEVVS